MPRFEVWHFVVASLAVTVWVSVHLFYYNLLVDMEYNLKSAWAQVETQLQRRYHIQQNLTQIVIDYSQYEGDLLTRLTEIRTSVLSEDPEARPRHTNQQSPAESSDPPTLPPVEQMTPSQSQKLFPDIMLVAEQYPQLKLTENFQQFSKAIIDTEDQIAEQIMEYNEAVNIYTTTRRQFPGNIFGTIFGFQMYEFYTPDEEVLSFQPVKY